MSNGFAVGTEGWVDLPQGMTHVRTFEGHAASFYEIGIPGTPRTMIVARHGQPCQPIIDEVRAKVAELAAKHLPGLIVCGSITASSIPAGSTAHGVVEPEPLETL